ncbi:hypothetical protein GCM10009603_54290 [Nocardiopsis exhalans]
MDRQFETAGLWITQALGEAGRSLSVSEVRAVRTVSATAPGGVPAEGMGLVGQLERFAGEGSRA